MSTEMKQFLLNFMKHNKEFQVFYKIKMMHWQLYVVSWSWDFVYKNAKQREWENAWRWMWKLAFIIGQLSINVISLQNRCTKTSSNGFVAITDDSSSTNLRMGSTCHVHPVDLYELVPRLQPSITGHQTVRKYLLKIKKIKTGQPCKDIHRRVDITPTTPNLIF